jgi:hypothetical protein
LLATINSTKMKTVITTIQARVIGGRVLLFVLACSGAVLWIMSSIVLAMAPAGNPPFTFRSPAIDVRLHLAVGLFLISMSLGLSVLAFGKVRSRQLTVACLVTITDGVVYVLGRLIRDTFLQQAGWDPLLPLGFLFCIGGLCAMGLVSFRQKAVSPISSMLLMVSAAFLLFFNDQFLPFMAVPFGLSVITLSAALGLQAEQE